MVMEKSHGQELYNNLIFQAWKIMENYVHGTKSRGQHALWEY